MVLQLFSTVVIIRKVSRALNQHITMISKESCDTENWSNGYWKLSFAVTGINRIIKYIKISAVKVNALTQIHFNGTNFF